MEPNQLPDVRDLHLNMIWVFNGCLRTTLDAATWLKTTVELRRLGWNVNLICAGDDGEQTIRGVDVFCISTPDIYFIRQVVFHSKLFFFLLDHIHETDVILFQQPSAPWIYPISIIRWFLRQKTPVMVMDTRTVPMEDLEKASFRDRLRGWFMVLMNHFGNLWADGQTAVTERMVKLVRIRLDKLWGLWPSAADLEQFEQANEGRNWPSADEPVKVAYIGVLHYERNLLSLCKAIEMANKQGMNFTLTLTGSGSQEEELARFAKKTDGRITVNPPVPYDHVPDILRETHVGALPFPDEQKYRASSPIKLYEYMASGLPVFATRITCHTDVISDEPFVFWAEGASPRELLEGLKNIWRDRLHLKQMSESASVAARKSTWAESARKLSDSLIRGMSKKTGTLRLK